MPAAAVVGNHGAKIKQKAQTCKRFAPVGVNYDTDCVEASEASEGASEMKD